MLAYQRTFAFVILGALDESSYVSDWVGTNSKRYVNKMYLLILCLLSMSCCIILFVAKIRLLSGLAKKYFVAIGKNDAFGCVLGERIRVGEANKIIFLFCRMENDAYE